MKNKETISPNNLLQIKPLHIIIVIISFAEYIK